MTEEKKLSPKERYDLINQKIIEIKELADDCVLLACVDNASKEANTIIASVGKAGKQAQMIDVFIKSCPHVGIVMNLIRLKDITEGGSKDGKRNKIGLWLALAMSFFICLSIVIDWYCK